MAALTADIRDDARLLAAVLLRPAPARASSPCRPVARPALTPALAPDVPAGSPPQRHQRRLRRSRSVPAATACGDYPVPEPAAPGPGWNSWKRSQREALTSPPYSRARTGKSGTLQPRGSGNRRHSWPVLGTRRPTGPGCSLAHSSMPMGTTSPRADGPATDRDRPAQ